MKTPTIPEPRVRARRAWRISRQWPLLKQPSRKATASSKGAWSVPVIFLDKL